MGTKGIGVDSMYLISLLFYRLHGILTRSKVTKLSSIRSEVERGEEFYLRVWQNTKLVVYIPVYVVGEVINRFQMKLSTLSGGETPREVFSEVWEGIKEMFVFNERRKIVDIKTDEWYLVKEVLSVWSQIDTMRGPQINDVMSLLSCLSVYPQCRVFLTHDTELQNWWAENKGEIVERVLEVDDRLSRAVKEFKVGDIDIIESV